MAFVVVAGILIRYERVNGSFKHVLCVRNTRKYKNVDIEDESSWVKSAGMGKRIYDC